MTLPNFLPSSPQLILLAAMAIMIWVLWRRSNKHFGRGGKAYEPPHRISKLEQDRDLALSDAPAEVTRWQVEMHELAREMKGELDTKMAVLQLLIRQATDAAARLDEAVQRAERLGLNRLADPLAALENWTPGAEQDVAAGEPARHPQAGQIYALADAGQAPAAIARQTGLSLGDIEMVLSLRETA